MKSDICFCYIYKGGGWGGGGGACIGYALAIHSHRVVPLGRKAYKNHLPDP